MLDRRTFITAAAGTAAGAAAVPLLAGAAEAAPFASTTVLAKDLRVPWGVAFLPNGNALVTERETGKVHLVRKRGGRSLVGTVPGVDTSSGAGEGGLLGVALSPTFPTDRLVHLYLTSDSDNRIITMRYVDGALSDATTLLSGIPRASNHNGGRLAFGPTGHLFASTGDSAEEDRAQNTSSLAGKILRLNPDGTVPDDNPFGNEVWSYGHRNVQGLAWDARDRLFATEFGSYRTDELNVIRKGANYGWPDSEGGDGRGGATDPYVTWSPTSSCSPSGVAITRGRAWIGALQGRCVFSVDIDGTGAKRIRKHLTGDYGRIRTVQLAPDGALWITTSNRDGRGSPDRTDDKVVRLAF